MIDYSCWLYDGDDDCYKCSAHGYIFYCDGCREYKGSFPEEHNRKFVEGEET